MQRKVTTRKRKVSSSSSFLSLWPSSAPYLRIENLGYVGMQERSGNGAAIRAAEAAVSELPFRSHSARKRQNLTEVDTEGKDKVETGVGQNDGWLATQYTISNGSCAAYITGETAPLAPGKSPPWFPATSLWMAGSLVPRSRQIFVRSEQLYHSRGKRQRGDG